MKCCPLEVYTFWDFQCILNEGAQPLPGTQATPAETRPVRFRYMSHLEETGDFLGVWIVKMSEMIEIYWNTEIVRKYQR